MDGVINVYKEKGFTSFDVVAKLRGILRQRKIGHTGTLDPDAEGVLPVCLGTATRACELLTDKDKTYEAVMLLGVKTDTQDITGTVLERKEVRVTKQQAEEMLLSFQGEYDQVPPMYSALKVNGKRLYELAREGRTVERQARRVTIYSIRILESDFTEQEKWVRFEVTCSKGTYIRTLCEDVGERLGCGACMKSLKRTRVSSFTEQESLTLARIEQLHDEGRLADYVLPVDRMFLQFPRLQTTPEADRLLINGNKLPPDAFRKDMDELSAGACPKREASEQRTDRCRYRIYDSSGRFFALYEYSDREQCFRNVRMFIPADN